MKEEKLTSVKIIDELYRKFKAESIRDDFSLQKLVNRSLSPVFSMVVSGVFVTVAQKVGLDCVYSLEYINI